MAWGYNNNRGGYNNNRGGYNNNNRGGWNGGYNNNGGGYNQGPNNFNNGNFRFDIGQKVIHRATGTELFVIRFGREQYECRKPDLSSDWFYEDELDPAEDSGNHQQERRQ